MGMIHCPSSHEPVVTEIICIYCKKQMKTNFDELVKSGHNFDNCDQCTLIEEI